jgi:hypothetical protein
VGHDVSSLLAIMLVVVVGGWLIGASMRRATDIIETDTVADKNSAGVRREDNPIWYWYTLMGLLILIPAIICALIGVAVYILT